MDHLAERMDEQGEYAVFVGTLGSQTHNQWVDAAIARQREAYPDMTLVGEKNEVFDDPEQAYEKAKELLAAHPDLKGFQGSGSTDVAGIGRAVAEAGMEDETVVVGTSLPSIAGDLLESGAIDVIGFWDPANAGEACYAVALKLLDGEPIETGSDLGVEGYDDVVIEGKVIYGDAAVYVTAENAGEYPF
jgi:simple sugar transport system substrate-binding protein